MLLHDREMRELLPAWRKACAASLRLPATSDPSYASLETLLHHAFRASGGYVTWLCEKLGLPDPGIRPAPAAEVIAKEADAYLEHLLERWRLPLAAVEDKQLEAVHTTRWGEQMSLEGMLEHAVVHPARHRFQLEELMEKKA